MGYCIPYSPRQRQPASDYSEVFCKISHAEKISQISWDTLSISRYQHKFSIPVTCKCHFFQLTWPSPIAGDSKIFFQSLTMIWKKITNNKREFENKHVKCSPMESCHWQKHKLVLWTTKINTKILLQFSCNHFLSKCHLTIHQSGLLRHNTADYWMLGYGRSFNSLEPTSTNQSKHSAIT